MHKFNLIKQFDNKDVGFKIENNEKLLKFKIDSSNSNPIIAAKSSLLKRYGAVDGEVVLIAVNCDLLI